MSTEEYLAAKNKAKLCLSVRQPWAWAIFHSCKDVENRTWVFPRPMPEKIYIQASKTFDKYGVEFCLERQIYVPGKKEIELGVIVGTIEVYDCVANSNSSWAIAGQYHWLLRNPQPIIPVPCKGSLGLFSISPNA